MILRTTLAGLGLSVAVLATARVAEAGCTEQTYGMPCDVAGGGDACSGVCLPDFTQSGAPMTCLAATADALARLKLTTLDGIDCAPSGAAGSDCAHACQNGACVAKNAVAGAACMPSGPYDSGHPGFGASVCSAACDGNGACAPIDHGCEKYGRGEIDECLYTACNVLANAPGCVQYPSPAGTACNSSDPCVANATCAENGGCVGTTIPGCTEPGGGALSAGDAAVYDAGPPVDDEVPAPPAHGASVPAGSSGGCGVGGGGPGTAFGAALAIVAALAFAARRRRA